MTKFKEWNINDTVGLLVGGTPCQSFSVAGLRKGLEDPRGNLALIYCGILDKFKPKWFLWENVPGVLSSSGGRDFGSFLGAVAELGYGFAYRVLDAQYFGVAQRRRRVFVVGYLGDWKPAAKVLFESESLCRDNPPSRSKKQNTSTSTQTSIGECSKARSPDGNNTIGTLLARDYKGIGNQDLKDGRGLILEPIVYETHPADSRVKEMGDVCQTVTSRWGTGGGNVPIALAENTIGRQPHNGGNGDGFTIDGPMYTLNATGVHGVAFQQNTRDEVRYINGDGQIAGALMAEPGMKQQNYIMQSYGFEPGIAKREGEPSRFVEEMAPTLRAGMGDNQTAVAIGVDVYNQSIDGEVAATLTQACGGSNTSGPKVMTNNPIISWDSELNPNVDKMGTLMRGGQGGRMDGVMHNMAVRRLTPIECERLQGFPDSYTDIKPQGKPTPDGHRYKALGNSMAVPVMKWIGERINQYEKGEL